MQYMLVYRESPAEVAKRADPVAAGPYWGAWTAYMGAIAAAGIMVNGDGLHPPETATLVGVGADGRTIQDGPFPGTKEQLGGYVVIDVADLDAAIEWAARAPCASDTPVEVRPVLPPPPQG
ncbi:YciI family protein [Sphingomonas sp. CJ99]